jgi:outer membrane receptor protein involved in Fe transport
VIQDSGNFLYADPEAGFQPQAPLKGTTIFDPSIRPIGTAFINDITRGYKQKAIFGDGSFDFIPKKLTLSLGVRFYSMPTFEAGSTNSVYGCRGAAANTCVGASASVDALGANKTYDGHKGKVTLTWKATDDVLVYATYSEGFRPGGFNRTTGIITANSPLHGIFTVPLSFAPDTLKNKELGWKTVWLNHRLQFNGALYQEDWYNVQVQISDAALYGNNNFNYNGPDYRVRGVEGDVAFRANDRLTVNASFAWNNSSQQTNPTLLSNSGVAVSLVPTAGLGSPLANAPPFQGNIRARYQVPFGEYLGYGQIGAQHSAGSYSSIITVGTFAPWRQYLEQYTTYDAALGVTKDAWGLELYGVNLSDTRAQIYYSNQDYVHLITTNRPRTIGLRMSYRF